MTRPNVNAYLHDLSEHLSVELQPARRREIVAVCSCGWRSPLAKKPDGAHRLYWQMHLRALQDEAAALRCPSCYRKTGGGTCDECAKIEEIFGTSAAKGIMRSEFVEQNRSAD